VWPNENELVGAGDMAVDPSKEPERELVDEDGDPNENSSFDSFFGSGSSSDSLGGAEAVEADEVLRVEVGGGTVAEEDGPVNEKEGRGVTGSNENGVGEIVNAELAVSGFFWISVEWRGDFSAATWVAAEAAAAALVCGKVKV